MLRNFLPALFFLLICFTICQPSFAEKGGAVGQNPLILFQESTNFENGLKAGSKFKSFTSPSFGYFENVLVVFAQAKESGEAKCEIVEGFAEFKNGNAISEKFLENSGDSLWTRRVVKTNGLNHCSGSPTAVFNNTHIFVFFNSSTTGGSEIKYQVIANKEMTASVSNGITWETSLTDLTNQLKDITGDLKNIIPVSSGDSGIAINNSLFLPVWYKKSKDIDEFIPIIISASKTGEQQWRLTLIKSFTEGKYPAIVKWGENLITMISSSDGYRKVYESINMGEKWTEAVGPLSGVWGNTKERKTNEYGGQWGFITANIQIEQESEGKKVMFLAQPVGAETDYKLHLWMTDNQRVFDAGEMATGVGQNISSTLLFEKDNLFAAYEKWGSDKSTIHVVHLKEKLNNIKNVLRKWIKQDDDLKKSCITAEWELKSDNTCTDDNKIPINGLVGFLSNNYSDDMWKDEYWCVNAAVTKTTGASTVSQVSNGLKFNGTGAGATWPVGNQEQNQRYYFVNRAFTLVATVKIDGEATGNKNSILGFVLQKPSKKTIGLWCSEGKWGVGDGKGTLETISTTENCVNEKTYQVALTFKEKTVSVYINGNKVDKLSENIINVQQQPLSITHFYFGANNGEQSTQSTTALSHVTVKNVLLYNRQFSDNEIGNLKPKQIKPQESVKTPKEDIKADQRDDNTAGGNSDPQTSPTLPQGSIGDEKEEKAPSPSRTEDGGMGGGVRVFSLLLALLCVSAPFLHL